MEKTVDKKLSTKQDQQDLESLIDDQDADVKPNR